MPGSSLQGFPEVGLPHVVAFMKDALGDQPGVFLVVRGELELVLVGLHFTDCGHQCHSNFTHRRLTLLFFRLSLLPIPFILILLRLDLLLLVALMPPNNI